jgi:hypothetical protein
MSGFALDDEPKRSLFLADEPNGGGRAEWLSQDRASRAQLGERYVDVITMEQPRWARKDWWAGLDSNQRSAFARQIYSLVPLTTRPPTHARTKEDLGYDAASAESSAV